MNIVIDTNVYFSAFGFLGRTKECLDLCLESDEILIFLSPQIFEEIQSKLTSPKFLKYNKAQHSIIEVDKIIKLLRSSAIMFTPETKVDICRDPKDNMILELSSEIQADYIITGDEDLLILKSFQGASIVKPSEFLALIK